MSEQRPEGEAPARGVPDGLKRRSVESGAFALAAQVIRFGFLIASTMVLARILTPRDFGLVAMASVFLAFVDSFRDFGLRMSLVALPEVDDATLSAVFWRSVAYAAGLLAVTVAAAPLLAWFFGEPDVTAILTVLALGLFVTGLTHVHLGLLRRGFRFRTIAASEVAASGSGALVGIAAALAGAGFWALVAQQVTGFVVQATVFWWGSDWRPEGLRAVVRRDYGEALRPMFTFGRDTVLVRAAGTLFDQADRILVGRLAGAATLGLYYTARRWSVLPIEQMMTPINAVAVASFSRLRSDVGRYRRYVNETLLVVFSVALPLCAFLIVDARNVILLLVGPQWLDAVPIFQILVVAAAGEIARRFTSWIYLSEFQTRRRLRWTMMSRPLTLLCVSAGAYGGPHGIAAGAAVAALALAHPAVVYCFATSPLDPGAFWRPAARPAAATAAAAAVVLAQRAWLPQADWFVLRLAADGAVFGAGYAAVWLGLPGGMGRARGFLDIARDAVGGRAGAALAAEAPADLARTSAAKPS